MKLALGIFILLTAFALSVVAAWFSITGMVALFSASAVGVIAMMTGLEFGKLVASGVLKMNWDNRNFNWAIKGYLLVAIATLMVITSIGIYGYLSAGHLEQKAPLAGLTVQSQQLEVKLAQRTSENTRIEQRMSQIDQNVAVFLKNDQGSKGLAASSRLSAESTKLQAQLDANNIEINKLSEQLVPLKMQTSEVEAKLGPVKYVAALFGWDDTEAAVRLVIIIIMVAFDPLAVVLMLAALILLNEWSTERKAKVVNETVDDDDDDDDGDADADADYSREPDVLASMVKIDDDDDAFMAKIDDAMPSVVDHVREAIRDSGPVEPDHRELIENPIITQQSQIIDTLSKEISHRDAELSVQRAEFANLEDEALRVATQNQNLEQEAEQWKDIAHKEFQRAYEWFERDRKGEPMEREELLSLLENNPSIIDEIEEIVEEDVDKDTDRQKLLDLLERDPTLINDMAEIIASTITGPRG